MYVRAELGKGGTEARLDRVRADSREARYAPGRAAPESVGRTGSRLAVGRQGLDRDRAGQAWTRTGLAAGRGGLPSYPNSYDLV